MARSADDSCSRFGFGGFVPFPRVKRRDLLADVLARPSPVHRTPLPLQSRTSPRKGSWNRNKLRVNRLLHASRFSSGKPKVPGALPVASGAPSCCQTPRWQAILGNGPRPPRDAMGTGFSGEQLEGSWRSFGFGGGRWRAFDGETGAVDTSPVSLTFSSPVR